MFERPGTERLEETQNLERLEGFIAATAARYRSEKVPVTDDGRIDMLAYTSLYPEAAQDFGKTREGQANASELREERLKSTGEKLEMLAHAVLAKNLPDFVVVRSSPYDDKVNGADTLLFERATGNLVCAFDEVGDTTGSEYAKKQDLVQKHNLKGGTSLKYGLRLEVKDGKTEVVPTSSEHIPLFYIALPADRVRKGMAEFSPETERKSEFETKLFEYFIASVGVQVNGLELYSSRLDPALRARLATFKIALNALHSKREKKN